MNTDMHTDTTAAATTGMAPPQPTAGQMMRAQLQLAAVAAGLAAPPPTCAHCHQPIGTDYTSQQTHRIGACVPARRLALEQRADRIRAVRETRKADKRAAMEATRVAALQASSKADARRAKAAQKRADRARKVAR